MGLLPADYDKQLLKEVQARAATATPAPIAPTSTATAPQSQPGIFDKISSTVNEATSRYIQYSPKPLVVPGQRGEPSDASFRASGDITLEKQAERFGGVVGSPEYYQFKADHPYLSFAGQNLGNALGIEFPNQETWDKMTRFDQTTHVAFGGLLAGVKLITSFPKEAAKGVVRFGYSVYKPWADLARGKDISPEVQAQREREKPLNVPVLGQINSYWSSYDDAKQQGLGPSAAVLVAGSQALGDVTISASLVEGLNSAFRPRVALKPGETVVKTEPIKSAIIEEQNGLKKVVSKAPDSTSEYYSLPKTVAAKYGGTTNNTFFKVIPAGQDTVQISVVQLRGGAIQRGVDYVKEKAGGTAKVNQGDFGPELKIESQIIPIGKVSQVPESGAIQFKTEIEILRKNAVKQRTENILSDGFAESQYLDALADDLAAGKTDFSRPDLARLKANGIELPVKGITPTIDPAKKEILDNMAAELNSAEAGSRSLVTPEGIGDTTPYAISQPSTFPKWIPEDLRLRTIVDDVIEDIKNIDSGAVPVPTTREGKLFQIAVDRINKDLKGKGLPVLTPGISSKTKAPFNEPLAAIPPRALKGMENKPITNSQISNLDDIARVNGIEPAIKDAVVRSITGRQAIGELTQKEYIDVAQTLSTFNNLGKYSQDLPGVNLFSQYVSPQRHWMRSYEEKSGIPLYSEVYVPIEDAMRLRNTFRNSYRDEARQIFGDYAKAGFAEERRLIKNYMEGDQAAITANSSISPAVKADLIDIAEKMRPLYDKLGAQFGIPTEVFLKDYQPHIQYIGGIHQIYKAGSEIPKELSFFADFKRHGSLQTQVDDALALFDIYTNAGSNKLFLNPALERVASLGEKLPATIQGSVKSYVGEKLGQAGRLEEWIDGLGASINKHLGTNLPPDVARQMTQLMMDTTYSGAMGLNPGTVVRNALQYDLLAYPRLGPRFYVDAARKALTKEGMAEVRANGFLVDLGVPYGEELAKDISLFGKAGNMYRKSTQATLAPFSLADNVGRARAYWQTKLQFEDALARYNAGKITWQNLEKDLDFAALSPIDRNIIRTNLAKGDTKAAFEHLVRDVIDDTQFPFRRGSSSRITYGLTGRLGTQFGQFSIEFAHTMYRWVKNKEFDKLIRFTAASSAIVRGFKEQGVDFTSSVGLGPVNPSFSPLVKTGISFMDMIGALKNENAEEFEANKDEIVRTMKALGRPVGVEINNWQQFFRSYSQGPIGPNGEYAVFDEKGRPRYYTSFADLFWQAFGFPTVEKLQNKNLETEKRNAKFNYSQKKQEALQLIQQEKFDEANDIINEYGIKISSSDYDQYYIPLTERTFDNLPSSLKAEFSNRQYPIQ